MIGWDGIARQVSVAALPSAIYAQVGHRFQALPDGFLVELVAARDQIYRPWPGSTGLLFAID